MNEQKKLDLLKKKRQAEILNMKKNDLVREFQELMSSGGQPDLRKIAKQYNLDYEELEKRVNEESRKSIVEISKSDNMSSTTEKEN